MGFQEVYIVSTDTRSKEEILLLIQAHSNNNFFLVGISMFNCSLIGTELPTRQPRVLPSETELILVAGDRFSIKEFCHEQKVAYFYSEEIRGQNGEEGDNLFQNCEILAKF